MKTLKQILFILLGAVSIQACTSTSAQLRHSELHSSSIANNSLVAVSTDSLSSTSCCSENGKGKCLGKAYCTACSNCSQCAHCNSGGSCGVCAGRSNRNSSTGTRTYSRPNSTFSGVKGQVSFWTNISLQSKIDIYIDGAYVGSLDSYFERGVPQCGQDGTVTVSKAAGKHSVHAKSSGGMEWKGTVIFDRSGCKTYALKK